jgi:hypothetical protein
MSRDKDWRCLSRSHWESGWQLLNKKWPPRRHCDEKSDETIEKPCFSMLKRSNSWRKRRMDCFASLAITGGDPIFNNLLDGAVQLAPR